MNSRISLRTELLVSLAIISATALTLAVASVLLLYDVLDREYAAVYMSILVAADVCILVAFVAYQVDKIVVKPLRRAVATAEAIAAGDLSRRLDAGDSIEMHNFASTVNRMTDHLLEGRAHVVRAEKLASVGRLAAGVAHEIGNPLGAINGYLHVMRKDSPSQKTRDAVAGLERESARIDRIVRGLLDYARPKHRASGNVDLNDVVRTVVDLLSTQGILKRVDLHISPAEHAVIPGDRHDLEQVLVNLVLNAVEAMDGVGSLSVIVRRTTRSELTAGTRRATDDAQRPLNPPSARSAKWLEEATSEDLLMVIVADSGPGVAPEDVDRIFEPFYTTKEPGKGTGLGLAIVSRSVENAGGIIWVSPSREGGAAFRMLFPAAAALPRRSLRVEGSVVSRVGVS